MRLYNPPTLNPRPPAVTTKLENSLKATNSLSKTSIKQTSSYRQYISRAAVIKPIRGRELFIRSIRRVLEQIRTQKELKLKQTIDFSDFQQAISIFDDLTFMKCLQLKKQLVDRKFHAWTVEFAQQGGLQALLNYIERLTTRDLSLLDAILVNEILQCLRAMMNIGEIFEHIVESEKYVQSIAKSIFYRNQTNESIDSVSKSLFSSSNSIG